LIAVSVSWPIPEQVTSMGMKPKNKDKRKRSAKFWADLLGKGVCHKCGEPTETGHDTCSLYPRCKQISERRIVGKVILGR